MLRENIDRRNFMKTSAIIAGSLALGITSSGMLFGCSSENGNSIQDTSNETDGNNSTQPSNGGSGNSGKLGKVLVAYYSAQGHTRRAAEAIANELGADLFEVIPNDVYSDDDLDWTDDNSRVTREHGDESLRDTPLKQTAPKKWDTYDTVIIGYPIWWGIAAWPINHFVSDNNFNNKTVIPFCTSASSGLGESGQLLAEAAGAGNWQSGQRFSSGAAIDEVRVWARSI